MRAERANQSLIPYFANEVSRAKRDRRRRFDKVFYGGQYNIVYLKCDPEIAFERKKKRNRKEEENLPLSYFKALHNCHENWLIKNVDKDKYNVLVLDCNKDFENNEENFEELYTQFKLYILPLQPYDFEKYLFKKNTATVSVYDYDDDSDKEGYYPW